MGMSDVHTSQAAANTGPVNPVPLKQGHHGSTPAAWTTVVIITIAFFVGTLAVVIGNWPMFWVGAALVVVGAVVGKIMQKAGLGTIPKR
ncbi:unannotated protein [freshwater metagenome]|uniref:Unannotated protein n=1 Tax=freshwater metagenome TaxID=449393 RepID=A0A6J7D3T6_9ZZZZ